LKLLVADDSASYRAMCEQILKGQGYELVTARDGDEAMQALLATDAPHLALLDWEMPGLDGVEVCRRVRANQAAGTAYTYMLLVTSRDAKADLVAGMEAGADDYVAKPYEPRELLVRLRAGRRIVELQQELNRLKDAFESQSRTDPLTGCLNRRAVMERLVAELARVQRGGAAGGVGVLDLDFFKRINDKHGHAAGDAVLRELVRRTRECLRVSDLFGRIGGEEFLLVWPATDLAGVRTAAERLRAAVAGTPFAVPGAVIKVTASIGVTPISVGGEQPEEAVARADAALYAAKQGGRDRVEVAAAPAA